MTPEVHLVWQAQTLLGEGPVWLPGEQALRFVDIKRGRVLCHRPDSGENEDRLVGGKPSFIVPENGGGLLVGSEHAIWRLGADGLDACVAALDQPAHNRTNDATVDTTGRLWFGTMDDEEWQATGAIWCLDRGVLRATTLGAVVTNGPAATSDASTLYHVDSGERTIWRHRIGDDARLYDSTVFVLFDAADGCPDGIVLDSEECLWVAMWDGWSVKRFSPAGELLLTVPLPCARVTKVAFGGPDLRTAYVTTASVGLDDAALALQPLAGGLFAFDAPVAGRVPPAVRLS